jgi:hypothetical protein
MADDLGLLPPESRASVEAFIGFYLHRNTGDFRRFLCEDCTFEGALTAGTLRGQDLVLAHMKQSLQGPFAESVLRHLGSTVTENRVVVRWAAEALALSESLRVEGTSLLDLDDRGLIQAVKIAWNPRPLLQGRSRG